MSDQLLSNSGAELNETGSGSSIPNPAATSPSAQTSTASLSIPNKPKSRSRSPSINEKNGSQSTIPTPNSPRKSSSSVASSNRSQPTQKISQSGNRRKSVISQSSKSDAESENLRKETVLEDRKSVAKTSLTEPVSSPQKTKQESISEVLGEEDEESEEEGVGAATGGESAQEILGSILESTSKISAAVESSNTQDESARKSVADGDEPEDPDDILEEINTTLAFLAEADGSKDPSVTDPAFVRLRHEYDRLHKLFMQSRRNEKALIRKCKDLGSELTANASKVQAAIKLSQNDRSTIAVLQKEVKKAWKMIEVGSEKEQRSKDAIASLKSEIETLRKSLINQSGSTATASISSPAGGGGWGKINESQEQAIRELTQQKALLTNQVESLSSENKKMSMEIVDLEAKVGTLTTERGSLDHEVHTLKDLLATKKSELDRDVRVREKMEATIRLTSELSVKKDTEIFNKGLEVRQLREQLQKMEQTLNDEKYKIERSEKEKELINAKYNRIQTEHDEQALTVTKLMGDSQKHALEIKQWEEDYMKMKEEYKSASRAKDSLFKRIKLLEETKIEADMERDALKSTNHSLQHDLDNLKHEIQVLHKQIENVTRERDIAQKNFVKATGATQKQLTVVKLSEQTKRNMEQEMMSYKEEASKMRKLIYSLEKDRDRHINEAGKIEQQLVGKEEEIKMKEMLIFDSKKKITELERKLKEQQALYENVRTDRNLYSKNLIESQDEIIEMKRKLKIMNHQIEQLKEEITNKEAALVKEHFEHSKLDKEKEALSIQIGKLQQQYEDAQQMIQNQQAEENKLRHIIAEADAERLRQKKEYDGVVQERDILGTQLIRRNDELSLLYEKIKIQTSTLNKGEIQYRERLEDIRVLKLEIKKLRREKAILQTETQNVEGLRNEIFRLQREVLRERTRVKVLEEELESPMNIHRWRKLSGSDPSTYELITKIQTLQKRLISKTEEVVEKELVIQQKERLYKEIKEVLQRQPGPEVLEELRVVKDAVKAKVRECKSLASELNMYHSQVNEYKYEIERLNRDQQELKKKYYDRRKRERANQEKANLNQLPQKFAAMHNGLLSDLPDMSMNKDAFPKHNFSRNASNVNTTPQYAAAKVPIKANSPAGPKFSGGGFNLSTTTHNLHNQYPINVVDSQQENLTAKSSPLPAIPQDASNQEVIEDKDEVVNAVVAISEN